VTNKFKIALVQQKTVPNDLNANTENGIEHIRFAKELSADIVLFPECWINGYEYPNVDIKQPIDILMKNSEYKNWWDKALAENSSYIKSFSEIAKALRIGVVITSFTKGESKPQNSAFVIDRNGNIIMKYSKVHTCDFSKETLCESGKEFKVCEFDNVKLGIMICYDREYPESARVLMLKGAEIILVPNYCGIVPARLSALSTRAYENMVGVVMANPPFKKGGQSCAYSPIVWDKDGNEMNNTILVAGDTQEDILIAEFDLVELREYRSREMMGNTFRKIYAYNDILSDKIEGPFIRI
jgi:predicted amidohydrolase